MASTPAFSPNDLSPEDRSRAALNVWGILVVGVLTVLAGASLYLCFRFLRQRFWKPNGRLLDAERLKLRRFELEEVEKATNNFSEEWLIGSGGFGNVYRGEFGEQGTLAIKKAHADSYQTLQEFRNEVSLLSKIKHKNLVGLVGFCEEAGPKGAKVLVYEYVPNGSLLEYIMGRGGRSLTWMQRVNIAIGAAKGIAHLHGGIEPSIIHRDIKPSNILVGDDFEAKVSDFGLVRSGPVGDESHVSSQIKGTPGYLDPAYCSTSHVTHFSDVFSFGVILLQLVAGRPAIESSQNPSNFHIIDWARPSLEQGNVGDIVDANLLTEECNMEVMLKMGQLGLRCAVKTPKDRPTMTQVWRELEQALRSIDRDLYPIHNQNQGSRGAERSSLRFVHQLSADQESFVSVNGVGLQRFEVEMDSLSFQSASLRCLDLEDQSVSVDVDINSNLKGIIEESSRGDDTR